jgi:hypothetical protein
VNGRGEASANGDAPATDETKERRRRAEEELGELEKEGESVGRIAASM